MQYDNQLVVTGNINDVGEQIRVNVPKSYRRGIELEGIWALSDWLTVNGNASFSENKIKDFTEFIEGMNGALALVTGISKQLDVPAERH